MRRLAPWIPMCPVLSARIQNSAVLHPLASRIPISCPTIGTPDSWYPTMSFLNKQRSLPDSKFEFGEEQGPSKGDPV
jgi:hypothetical protein